MAPAVIIERHRTVASVMETMSVFDHDRGTVMMMPVVRFDHHISFGGGCDSRSGHAERQSGEKHCFHCEIPVNCIAPSSQ
ncbi:hypothetical protein MPLSOD_90073 [Mesorhizobium sp. SOD10]|nr:hypothetical protein MPLSOD_90073 [Mesorhizobium sp. SOD10]